MNPNLVWIIFTVPSAALLLWACRSAAREDRLLWEDTTTARRTEADVHRDLAEARAALDLAECQAMWAATPHNIPQQTRRTEDNQ